jgi:MFS family permease
MQSTAERRQMILQALCERRSELAENLAVEFGVTTRTIYNDIEILAYSYPIYTVQGIGGGIHIILGYCLPYFIIDMKEYGKMVGISTAFSGGVSFALSFVHTFCVAKFDYMQVTAWFFILAIVCFILTSIVCLSMKEMNVQVDSVKTKKVDVVDVFKNKDTYLLLLPNFARGLAAGIMNVIAVIGITKGILNEQTSSYVNIVMQVAMLVGNILYVVSCKKISSTTLLIISTIGMCGFLPFCIGKGMVWFLLLFFLAYLFRMICDTVIPVVVTEIIPLEQIGAYTSIRMLVFTGAQAVATLIIVPIVNVVGYTGLLIFAAIMQFLCGVMYYTVAKNKKLKF